jgi:signal transduction histidine kinase
VTAARWSLVVVVAVLALAFGVDAVTIARGHPDLSLAGDAPWASATELAAGWAVVAAGLAHAARRPASRCGPLLAAAGTAWFLSEAQNPESGSALVFTAGLVLFAACPALVAHAALTYAGGQLGTRVDVVSVALGYVATVGVLGLATAMLYDPTAQGCLECPANLVHLGGSAAEARSAAHAGLWMVFGWGALTVALLLWRLIRASAATRRVSAPVAMPAAVFLAFAAADAAHGIGRGFESNDSTDRALWAVQALTLVLLSLGITWERIRSRRMRAELARLVVELGRSPSGRVRDALARALGEPRLRLAYCGSSGDWLGDDGRSVSLPPYATLLGPADAPIAAVVDPPETILEPEFVEEIVRAARPTFEHERLQAEMRARLEDLRASRRRIVAAGDAERRRLERDLHDGAQQRIVALALDLRLARRHIARARPELDDELGAAEDDLRRAVAELRDVARGIHPPMLEDAGLAAALNALAEDAPRLMVGDLPCGRFPAAIESAAYHLVTETLREVRDGDVAVRGGVEGTTLALEVAPETGAPNKLTAAEDRIGALGGRLIHETAGMLRAELPCA